MKRKSVEAEISPSKKKKVHFNPAKQDNMGKPKETVIKKGEKIIKKKFDKNDTQNVKKFNKPGFKGKPNNDKFSKNKTGDGEKPKWSEMKKEKKTLRTERRKAKATAEVFEISHKAKLLAAQIQR